MVTNANPSWGPWASADPMAAFGDPTRLWGMSVPGAGAPAAAAWPVDPLELATAGLETWRWLVNAQLDLAQATLSSLRR